MTIGGRVNDSRVILRLKRRRDFKVNSERNLIGNNVVLFTSKMDLNYYFNIP